MMNEWILSSSLLIGAVLLGRQLLRGKISLRLQYALWALVLVRLLLPVQLFTSDFGAGTIARDVDISEPIRQVYVSANEERYEIAYDEAYQWISDSYASAGQQIDPVVIGKTAQNLVQTEQEVDLKGLLTKLWLGGMAVMTAVIVLCNLHLSRRLKLRRWEFPAADCLLPVYVTEAVPTPCIFGLFRPVIYLTPEAAKDEQIRRHVLAHEQTHYRHADHIWSVLRTVCLVLHWYNPLVWLAVKASKTDAELACDEGVLARLGESHRGDYGRTLIGLTCSAPLGDFLLTATTMTGSAGSIRQRIRLLMARPRNTVLTLTAVILIGTLVVGCTFAGAPEATEPTPSEPSATLPEEDLLGLIDGNGLLVYPGTRWNMTKAEVMAVLGLAELPATSMDSCFTIENHTFLGQDAEISFFFWQYRPETEWGLSSVTVTFADEDGANEVIQKITEALGKPDHAGNGLDFRFWYSDANVEDLLSPEAYQLWQEAMSPPAGTLIDSLSGRTASFLHWLGARSPADNPKSTLSFEGNITPGLQIEEVLRGENQTNRFDDPVEEVRELLNPYDSWYAQALTSYYDHPAGIDLFQLFYNGIPGVDNTPSKEELTFLNGQPGYNPDFDLFRIPGQEMDQVLGEYLGIDRTEALGLGLANFMYDPQSDCYYHCHTDTNANSPTVTAAQELPNGHWQVLYTDGFLGDGVVTLRQRDGKWQILSNLPIGTTPPALPNKTDVVRSLLSENGDADALTALTRLWSGHYGIAESKHVDPFLPKIVDCVLTDEDTIYVYYNRPGSAQLYQAEMAPHADSWAVVDNVMVLAMADYADKNLRELTEEELQQFRSAFRAVREDNTGNPAACFLATCFSDITQMDGSEFLAYFPTDQEGTREEFELLKAKYPEFFGEWTFESMPLPIHRYSAKEIETVVSGYANIHWPELDEGVHYLDETGCYYNYTSDFGLGGFYAKGGWVYDGGAVIFSGFSALFFDETMGQYSIRAHLPAIVLGLPSSQPMIPAGE